MALLAGVTAAWQLSPLNQQLSPFLLSSLNSFQQ